MSETIGRNDLCYCGSGKKYKHCHLKIEQAEAQEARAWESAVRFLRRDLIAFAREERYAESFALGVALFFNNYHTIETAHEMSELESLRFFDWFTFDYSSPDHPRLIEAYAAEKGGLMDEREGALLQGWLSAGPACAYSLAGTSGENKQTMHLTNLFDDSQVVIPESGGPGRAEEGDILIARVLPFQDELRLGAATGYLPAEEAVDLKPFVLDAWHKAQQAEPDLAWEQFLRSHSYLFAHYELDAAKKAGRPPVAHLDPERPQSRIAQIARRAHKRK